MIKRVFKMLLTIILSIAGIIAVYYLASLILTLWYVNGDYQEPEQGIPIYLISNGVHVDVCLPASGPEHNWMNLIDTNDFEASERKYKYVSFGWGDKGFYIETPTWADLKISTAIKALFVPSTTAMHLTLYEHEPKEGDKVKKIMITKDRFQQLSTFIIETFEFNEANKFERIDAISYYDGNDNFYEAKGAYHLFRTCNCWTNEAMKEAGVKTSVWALFEWSMMYHYK